MSTAPSSLPAEPEIASLEAFDELIAAVADLQRATEETLRERREWLRHELASVETELADLAGTAESAEPAPPATPVEEPKVAKKARVKAPAAAAREIVLAELVAELEAAPNHTLNIRKAHLDVKSVKALAKANSHLLQLGGKGGWPTVTLVELSGQSAAAANAAASPQGVFPFGETSSVPPGRKEDSAAN